ncbi:hypothetical protein AAMO2058_001759400 [Amorphochlora amoebiformis]
MSALSTHGAISNDVRRRSLHRRKSSFHSMTSRNSSRRSSVASPRKPHVGQWNTDAPNIDTRTRAASSSPVHKIHSRRQSMQGRRSRSGSITCAHRRTKSEGVDFSTEKTFSRQATEFIVAILGAEKVGKSSLVGRLITGKMTKIHDPTIEDNYRKEICKEGKRRIINVIDTAGHSVLRENMMQGWIENADGFMLVYSVDDRGSFKELKNLHANIVSKKGPKQPIIVVGNKSDSENRKVTHKEAKEFSEKLGLWFSEVSALMDDSYDKIFVEILDEIENMRQKKMAEKMEKKKKLFDFSEVKKSTRRQSTKKPPKTRRRTLNCALM